MDVPGQLAFYFSSFEHNIRIARVEGAVALGGPGLDLEVLDAPHFNARGLAKAAWAFATMGPPDGLLFVALASAAEQHVNIMTQQGITNMAWSFAKAGEWHVPLFVALARAAERRIAEFNAQDIIIIIKQKKNKKKTKIKTKKKKQKKTKNKTR